MAKKEKMGNVLLRLSKEQSELIDKVKEITREKTGSGAILKMLRTAVEKIPLYTKTINEQEFKILELRQMLVDVVDANSEVESAKYELKKVLVIIKKYNKGEI